jgi:hypothetical protein
MGREVRMVPPDWEHPKNDRGHKPLFDNYAEAVARFAKDIEEMGLRKAIEESDGGPRYSNYMHPEGERTHYMMYEDMSDGTPISPAFATPEELALWLTENNASAFGRMTATYEQWLNTIRRGWAPSAVFSPDTGLQSGVTALSAN